MSAEARKTLGFLRTAPRFLLTLPGASRATDCPAHANRETYPMPNTMTDTTCLKQDA